MPSVAEMGEDRDVVEQVELPEGEPLRLNDWAVPAAWVLATAAGLAGLFLLLTTPLPESSLRGPLRYVLALVWLGFGALVALGARRGLILRERGIAVRSRLRETELAWGEIERFRFKRSFGGSLRIELRDGRELRAAGFEARSSEEVERAEAIVAELNRRASE